jgi:CheY-like chemotaxis protein
MKTNPSEKPGEARPIALVAEDNPFNRELLVRILGAEGMETVEARDGREALELVRSREFRIIFMDILMPRMGGIEAIHRVRNAGVTTPIVIVSALSSRADRLRCLEAGGDEFLPKPVDRDRIRALIRQYAGGVPPNRSETPAQASAPFDFTPYRALLVDADAGRADRIRTLLEAGGLSVETAESGGAAWERFRERPHRYHFIVSQLFVPDIDGPGLLARIRKDFAEVPVFIVLETPDPDTAALVAELGASGAVPEADLETTLPGLLESAAYRFCRDASCAQPGTAARQVRQAQARLTRLGCEGGCANIDIAHRPLTDAGGDLAICRRMDGETCGIFLGDVAGHSVMASYMGAMCLGMLTSAWPAHPEPGDLIRTLNRKLTDDAFDAHLCAAALRWRRSDETVEAAMAGLPGGLRARPRPDGSLDLATLDGGGLCLGLVDRDELFLEDRLALASGDWLFLHTDGIRRDELAAALTAEAPRLTEDEVSGMGNRLLDRILHIRAQDDDAALIVLHAGRDREWRYTLASRFEAVDEACARSRERLALFGLPAGVDPDEVQLALREALNNAVEHGNGFSPDRTVDLVVRRLPDRLILQVTDRGSGPPDDGRRTTDEKSGSPDTEPDIAGVPPFQRRGRGLPTLRTLADRVRWDGGTVTMIFQRKAK